jgi:hypothetical protein
MNGYRTIMRKQAGVNLIHINRIFVSHNSEYEKLCLLGYNTMQSPESQRTCNGLQGVISQKIESLIQLAMSS